LISCQNSILYVNNIEFNQNDSLLNKKNIYIHSDTTKLNTLSKNYYFSSKNYNALVKNKISQNYCENSNGDVIKKNYLNHDNNFNENKLEYNNINNNSFKITDVKINNINYEKKENTNANPNNKSFNIYKNQKYNLSPNKYEKNLNENKKNIRKYNRSSTGIPGNHSIYRRFKSMYISFVIFKKLNNYITFF